MGIPDVHECCFEIERVAGSAAWLRDEVPGERQVIYGNFAARAAVEYCGTQRD